MNYIDAFVGAVPKENKQKYIDHLKEASALIKEYGATRMVENWEDDVPKGKTTDFYSSVKAKENESIVFSWIEWPSKEVRDEGMQKMMHDPRMKEIEMPFDGERMIYGGFAPIFDQKF